MCCVRDGKQTVFTPPVPTLFAHVVLNHCKFSNFVWFENSMIVDIPVMSSVTMWDCWCDVTELRIKDDFFFFLFCFGALKSFWLLCKWKTAKTAKTDCPINLSSVEDLVCFVRRRNHHLTVLTCCHHGMIVSDLWPSLPPPSFLSISSSVPKQSSDWGGVEEKKKKELLLRKLHTAETGRSHLNCWLALQGCWVQIRPFSQTSSHFGPWKENGREISCFPAQVRLQQAACAVRDTDVLCTRGKRPQWPVVQCLCTCTDARTHTHFPGGYSVPQEAPSAHKGPEKAS